jgi:hypothetical protein
MSDPLAPAEKKHSPTIHEPTSRDETQNPLWVLVLLFAQTPIPIIAAKYSMTMMSSVNRISTAYPSFPSSAQAVFRDPVYRVSHFGCSMMNSPPMRMGTPMHMKKDSQVMTANGPR